MYCMDKQCKACKLNTNEAAQQTLVVCETDEMRKATICRPVDCGYYHYTSLLQATLLRLKGTKPQYSALPT